MTRAERLAELLAAYQAAASDYDEGEEEDPRPYLDGVEPCGRFCCVTVNYSSHGSAKHFFLPTFEERDAAELRAVEYAQDGLFEELPVAVVDLETGEKFEPDWSSVTWSKC